MSKIKWIDNESIVYVTEDNIELIPFYFKKEIEPEREYIRVGNAEDGLPEFTGTNEYLEFETEDEAENWLNTINPLGIVTNFNDAYSLKDLNINWIVKGSLQTDLSWKEAIRRVLKGKDEDKENEMHYYRISKNIAQRRLKQNLGAIPNQTVKRVLTQSIKDNENIFKIVRKGYYRLI